jgi:hypothetical protein
MAKNGTPLPGGGRRRTAHGRAAELGASVVYEAPALGEVWTAPEGAADPIDRRGNGTFTAAGAAAAARRRADLEKMPDFAGTPKEERRRLGPLRRHVAAATSPSHATTSLPPPAASRRLATVRPAVSGVRRCLGRKALSRA